MNGLIKLLNISRKMVPRDSPGLWQEPEEERLTGSRKQHRHKFLWSPERCVTLVDVPTPAGSCHAH